RGKIFDIALKDIDSFTQLGDLSFERLQPIHFHRSYERLYTTLSRRMSFLLRTPWRCIPRSAEGALIDMSLNRVGLSMGRLPQFPPAFPKVPVKLMVSPRRIRGRQGITMPISFRHWGISAGPAGPLFHRRRPTASFPSRSQVFGTLQTPVRFRCMKRLFLHLSACPFRRYGEPSMLQCRCAHSSGVPQNRPRPPWFHHPDDNGLMK